MTWLYAIVIFLLAGSLLYIGGELLVSGKLRLARFYGIKEFVVAFFVMAFAGTLPNFFVGVTSALQGVPELSYGDVMGNNIVALTLAVGLALVLTPARSLSLDTSTVQYTTFMTACAALLPLILISDGALSRSDGLVLLLFFIVYVAWLFSRNDNFSKIYEADEVVPISQGKREALGATAKILTGIVLLAVSAQAVVYAAQMIGVELGLPLMAIGVLIVGFGGALPEIYFTIISARKGDTDMLLGNLMGAVISPATLVLGVVAMIQPIQNANLEFPVLGRLSLAFVALYFLYASYTSKTITLREGYALLLVYILFIASMVVSVGLVDVAQSSVTVDYLL
jgi:cation:H+ antiporter